ncbi:hypothetical protein G4228_007998 [Cervus hanglu yarkandensis]|nr:hypothetical protein G4228_007998 [Cervus hanglu yarkandensis]
MKSEHPRGKARVWGTAPVAALTLGAWGLERRVVPPAGEEGARRAGRSHRQRQSWLSAGRPQSHAEAPGQPRRPAPSSRLDLLPGGTPTVGTTGAGSQEHAHLSGARQGLLGTTASRPGSAPEPSPAPPGRWPRRRRRGCGQWGNS